MFHLQKNILKIFITPPPLRLVWMFQVESILGGISAALCCGEFLRAARKSGADSNPLHRSPDVHLVMVRSEKKYSVTVARTPIAPPKFYVIFFEPQRFLRRTPPFAPDKLTLFFSVYNCNTCNFLMKSSFSFENQPSKPCCVVVFLLFTTMIGPRFFGGAPKCCLKWMHWSIWDLNPLIMGFYSLHPWNST